MASEAPGGIDMSLSTPSSVSETLRQMERNIRKDYTPAGQEVRVLVMTPEIAEAIGTAAAMLGQEQHSYETAAVCRRTGKRGDGKPWHSAEFDESGVTDIPDGTKLYIRSYDILSADDGPEETRG